MLRSLIHYWRMNLAVAAGVGVTTAVLTGALMVGDSMRGSLQALTLDRLGRIEHALLNDRFFSVDLVRRLAERQELADGSHELVPVILLRGSALHPSTERRASRVQIAGVDERFAALFQQASTNGLSTLERRPNQVFPSVIVSQPLLRELGAEVGEDLLLSFGRAGDVPTASLLGRRDEDEVLDTLRLTITEVLPPSGPGRFSLEARQTRSLNAYVELSQLQRRLDRPDQVNTLLVAGAISSERGAGADPDLGELLRRTLTLDDLGLALRPGPGYLAVESRELVLRPRTAAAVDSLAERERLTAWPFLTYLANTMQIGERLLPYSTVTALQFPLPRALGTLATTSGQAVEKLGDDEILLNRWAAEDLPAERGDALEMTFYVVGAGDQLRTASARFRVRDVVEMEGLSADPSLTPDVPGVSDADDIAGWDPPFEVDLGLVRPQDEAYWDEFRGTPKAFVSLAAGRALWRSRYGELTSIRLVPAPGADLDRLRSRLEPRLTEELVSSGSGFQWLPVRARGLRGAAGTTDFAGLFVGFSLFLIVSAALLVGLLFALLVEQRSRETGLLLATGYRVRAVRRRLLSEGGLVAASGAVAGIGLAVLYARGVLRGLQNWWSPVVDAPFLSLYVEPSTLVTGYLTTLLLVIAVITSTVRRLSRLPTRRLLAGSTERLVGPRPSRRAALIAGAAFVLALALLAAALVVGLESAPSIFFGIGAALLVGGIALFSDWTQRTRRDEVALARLPIPIMAARNSARSPGRSLLSVTLVACACFVLVSVAANRKSPRAQALSPSSGTGGLALVAEADTPLPATIGAMLTEPTEARFFDFRLLPGDDASCLNLYQPEQPRVLGAPADFLERGGFSFRGALEEVDNPWRLLERPLEGGAIPAIGDYNSVRWILHSGLGEEVVLTNDRGEPVRLRIVGLLETSIFQSELVIAERFFLEHFPDHSGYAFFLGELPADRLGTLTAQLESRLAAFGLDVGSTVERLAGFQAVENMYLTTFEVLGGLGLLLGTLGLGVVLLRNTLERRSELATLRAFGYRRSTLAWMVVAENVFLLAFGLLIGSLAGLIAVTPHLVTGGIEVPWASLAVTLTVVFAVGLLASVTAVLGSLRVPLLPALKAD